MKRLCIACEGLTEVSFVTQVIKPHLEDLAPGRVSVSAPNLKGYRTYSETKKFVKNLLPSHGSGATVTTMIDLFKIPGDYPGLAEASHMTPVERVNELERRFVEDVDDHRFFAYLQLHEFEALLLADVSALIERHPSRRKEIHDLAARLDRDFESTEQVNRLRPPSYWIKDAAPAYNKKLDGPVVAAAIGLPRLRERCPHFGQWLRRAEEMARTQGVA
ncbi:MAG: DUF4276 family protein [Bryobacteraceae bacterium]